VQDLAFLPDNRTLAVPVSGFMKGEPVKLWRPEGAKSTREQMT
jgi:hypothetical protein